MSTLASADSFRRRSVSRLGVGLTLVVTFLGGLPASWSKPPRYTVAKGQFELPLPTELRGVDKLVLGALLDLAPLKDVLDNRYTRYAASRDFRQSLPERVKGLSGPATFARDFSVNLSLRVEDEGARAMLGIGRTVEAPLSGRLVARRLAGNGGCGSRSFGYGLVVAVFQSPPKVRAEFGGLALKLCVTPKLRRQCIVHALEDGTVVDTCYPTATKADFDVHVCNRRYLDRQRLGLRVAGAVACYPAWTMGQVSWRFDVIEGFEPTPWYRSFIRSGLRVFGAVIAKQLAGRYKLDWLRRFGPAHGALQRP